jgi:hypothetical protein
MQVRELRSMWQELWFNMADGIKSEYDRIKATNVFEFYELFDLWRKKTEADRSKYQKKTKQQGNGK